MIDLEAIRKAWVADEARYNRFVVFIVEKLKHNLREAGIRGEVSGRAKEIDSLLKKVIRRAYDDYSQVTDKAGARIVVRFQPDADLVERVLRASFAHLEKEDKAAKLGINEFGYEGVHYQCTLTDEDVGPEEFSGLSVEIQVRTLSQDLWAQMSHELWYKSDIQIPRQIERRLFSLSALVEMADNEFSRLHNEIRELPLASSLRVLSALERQYFKFSGRSYDRELSLEVIAALAGLYHTELLEKASDHFEEFCSQHFKKLSMIFDEYGRSQGHSPFLFQPEVLMIFDLLERDQFTLSEAWGGHFPPKDLEDLAVAWGKPMD